MERRQFLHASAVSAAAFALDPAAQEQPLHPAIAALQSLKPQEPPPISEAERAERRAKAQQLMSRAGIHALLVEPGPSLMYFTGIQWGRSERLFGMLLPSNGNAVFVSPAFEKERAETQINGRFDIRVWQEDESPYTLVANSMNAGPGSVKLAVESSARFFVAEALAKVKPSWQVVTGDPITQGCRGRKTAPEVALMRHANKVTIEAYRAALQTLRAGMTQSELGRNVSASFQRLGYSGGALVLFGESSAYPHGMEKPRALEDGQIVLVDGGTSAQGYASDVSRTVVFGKPSAEQQKVYDIVREAQARAFAAVKPGVEAGVIDGVARDYVTAQGYGPDYKYFTHRLGHGIGLEGHEWPYFVRGSKVILQPGMSFSDEPGIYQYGKFGVRLEDILVVTETGAEMLTSTARSLAITDI